MIFPDDKIIEVLERKVVKIGNGSHVIVPKKYLKRTVKIVILKEGFFE